MSSLKFLVMVFIVLMNLYANENEKNLDKLDVLDKQSKEFFKAITGLEKDYLEEQITQIKNKKIEEQKTNSVTAAPIGNAKPQEVITQEDYEKNVFKHQNELARLTTDFTRTKKLKDLKIKSMYSFNGKDYVVLKLEDGNTAISHASKDELSTNIEGRYIKGDYILGHLITSVNVRTKSIELYKKLDEEYGYTIYLSNYGINVSDLEKIKKVNEKKVETKKEKIIKEEKNTTVSVKEVFSVVDNKSKVEKKTNECLYKVNILNLNVRNNKSQDATILRVLKKDDKFTVVSKNADWLKIGTIYKNVSGDVMPVENENNWLNIVDNNVSAMDNNCF